MYDLFLHFSEYVIISPQQYYVLSAHYFIYVCVIYASQDLGSLLRMHTVLLE